MVMYITKRSVGNKHHRHPELTGIYLEEALLLCLVLTPDTHQFDSPDITPSGSLGSKHQLTKITLMLGLSHLCITSSTRWLNNWWT